MIKNEWMKQKSIFKSQSVEHGPDFVVKSLVVQVIDFDGLEVLFGVEVAFSDEESLSQDKFLK